MNILDFLTMREILFLLTLSTCISILLFLFRAEIVEFLKTASCAEGKAAQQDTLTIQQPRELDANYGIVFETPIGPKPIQLAEVKVGEFCNFLDLAVKYGDRELIAIGTGNYSEKERKVKVESIYPVMDADSSSAFVRLTSKTHRKLGATFDRWNEKEEVMVLHTHPRFSTHKSGIDDAHGIRMASILFDGKAVMVIVNPFSQLGIDVSAYAINPVMKNVERIALRLVP